MRKSIFGLERREELGPSVSTFMQDLMETKVISVDGTKYRVFEYIDHCVKTWPYREGAISVADYMKRIGVDITKPEKDEDILYLLELYANLLKWAPLVEVQEDRKDTLLYRVTDKSTCIENEAHRLYENLEHILEACCNMTIREDLRYSPPRYYITKRNAKIDVTIEIVPELKDILLGYTDIRNTENCDYKKKALLTIYEYMEDKRNAYKGLSCSAISEEFFQSMNAFGIRHCTKSQIRLQGKKRIMVYNHLFYMALYVLQTDEVNKSRDYVKAARTKEKKPDIEKREKQQ